MKPYYQDESVTLYHGDCMEIVPSLGRFDLLLTDPPYGINASSGVGKYGVRKWGGGNDKHWDKQTAAPELMSLLLGAADKHIVWGGNYYEFPPSRQFLVWDKGAGFKNRSFAECEMAWCSMDGNAKIFARDPLAAGDYVGKEHPTQKPLALMLWCLGLVPTAITVLDPFAGSGTTGRACKDLGRRCVLIERDEKYCEIAAKRMGQEVLSLG
jgi:site-specific DNA-methyltransferase (adenine-specific)